VGTPNPNPGRLLKFVNKKSSMHLAFGTSAQKFEASRGGARLFYCRFTPTPAFPAAHAHRGVKGAFLLPAH
jgi:hypothetical protein